VRPILGALHQGKSHMQCALHRVRARAFAFAFLAISLVSSDVLLAQARIDQLEEIVVTSSRREQSLQDVPAAVAVLDPGSYSEGGLNTLTDVLKYVPGVNFNSGGAPGQGSVTIRGVANIFSTASVGIYVDDVPSGSSSAFAEGAKFALDSLLGNVERVEMSKGPQGTQFGASSVGGAVRHSTEDPWGTDDVGWLSADFSDAKEGDTSQLYRGSLSVPLVQDRVAVGVSGFWQEAGGFVDETTRGIDDANDAELRGGTAN